MDLCIYKICIYKHSCIQCYIAQWFNLITWLKGFNYLTLTKREAILYKILVSLRGIENSQKSPPPPKFSKFSFHFPSIVATFHYQWQKSYKLHVKSYFLIKVHNISELSVKCVLDIWHPHQPTYHKVTTWRKVFFTIIISKLKKVGSH